jgi:hypothetical protein
MPAFFGFIKSCITFIDMNFRWFLTQAVESNEWVSLVLGKLRFELYPAKSR